MNKKLLLFILLTGTFFHLKAQQPEINGSISNSMIIGDGDATPFWLYSRQEGRWATGPHDQFLSTASVNMYFSPKRRWHLNAEAEVDYNSVNNKAWVHKGYVSASWRELNLTIGRHVFNPVHSTIYSGHGSYLFGDNYRPVDRITAGIPEYTKLFFPYGRIEIRGGISHGFLDDKNGEKFHKEVILHEKYAYLRLDLGKWMPYAGLNHSALIGGYASNGEKIPVDYWKSFFAKGSEKIGGGDATNAAGAHMGLYDFGVYFSHHTGSYKFYYQKPFADGSGMRLFSRNRDHIAGINWIPASNKIINNITFEWIKTTWQSGKGVPDPIILMPDGSSRFYTIDQLRHSDLDQLMADLGHERQQPYTLDEVLDFIQHEFNQGHRFGGRDGYMSNGSYSAGWTHYGMIMGSPLNLTNAQLIHINANKRPYDYMLIINDRFNAFHLGATGNISNNIQWATMLTYSINYGSYYQQYPEPTRYTWDETENYFFKGGKSQFYSMIGLSWTPNKIENIKLTGSMAMDTGELYKSYGSKFGIIWHF